MVNEQTTNRMSRIGPVTSATALGWLVAMLPLGLTIYFLSLLRPIAAGETLVVAWAWAPSLGVNFSFYLDGLSLLLALLVSGIGTLIILYSGQYLAGDDHLPRFYALLSLFMVAMLGLVTAGNLITLFLFWELTSITSYLLIGYKHKSADARDAALQALLVTGGGGLALLAGLLLMGMAAGSFELSAILASDLQAHPLYGGMVVLILAGAFTKSAQFPFHFWLPGAMSAPTPASAYLHSATMVKAGVYLLARLTPALGGTALWMGALVGFGTLTMLVGAWLAWQQSDLKRILAYSTVSALGSLVMLIGLGTEIATKAALVFLLVHSLYKAALFLVAGNVDHGTGSRDITRLGGLRRAMPYTALAAGLAALAMAGMAPFLGFVSKELIYEAALNAPRWALALTALALVANTLNVVVAGLVAVRPFLGGLTETSGHAHEGGWSMAMGPLLLAALGLAAGFVLLPLGETIIAPAAMAVAGAPVAVKLAMWHGINPMLILSVVTLLLGGIAYFGREWLLAFVQPWPRGEQWGPSRGYSVALAALNEGSKTLTRQVQSGQLRRYVSVVLATAALLLGWVLWQGRPWQWPTQLGEVRGYEVVIAVMMLWAAVMATRARSRLTAVVALGVVGYGMTLFFVLFSAPDLAMTQFAIETLTVLVFVLVLYRLPRFVAFTRPRERFVDAVVAISFGLVMASIVLIAVALPHPVDLATFFAQNSLTEANGRNVVNVILVDFRSMDTLGEITVLVIAAIGVFALMRGQSAGGQASTSQPMPLQQDTLEQITVAEVTREQETMPVRTLAAPVASSQQTAVQRERVLGKLSNREG
jgi:multicomponent Na+:H+ antiporter subunit A